MDVPWIWVKRNDVVARLRAAASSDLEPPEKALAHAIAVADWLGPERRAAYAHASGWDRDGELGVEEFVDLVASERRVALEEGIDPMPDELESAAQAERDARQVPLRILEAILLVLACAAFLAAALSDITQNEGRDGLPGVAVLLLPAAVALVLLAAAAGSVARRLRDRRLLAWAVAQRGQLARGIPVRRPLQRVTLGPSIVRALCPALMLALGVASAVAGALILLLSLLDPSSMPTGVGALLLALGVVCFGLSVLWFRLNSRWTEETVRRAQSVAWLGEPLRPR